VEFVKLLVSLLKMKTSIRYNNNSNSIESIVLYQIYMNIM